MSSVNATGVVVDPPAKENGPATTESIVAGP